MQKEREKKNKKMKKCTQRTVELYLLIFQFTKEVDMRNKK